MFNYATHHPQLIEAQLDQFFALDLTQQHSIIPLSMTDNLGPVSPVDYDDSTTNRQSSQPSALRRSTRNTPAYAPLPGPTAAPPSAYSDSTMPSNNNGFVANSQAPTAAEIAHQELLLKQREFEDREAQMQYNKEVRDAGRRRMQEELEASQRLDPTPANSSSEGVVGETIPLFVHSVAERVPGVLPKDILLIHLHKFEPYSLPRLRVVIGARTEDNDTLLMMDPLGNLTSKRSRGNIKDFGDNVMVWIESFLVYARILTLLFGGKHPELAPALLHFANRIIRASLSFEWISVLTFALDWHSSILATSALDCQKWIDIPPAWESAYLNSTTTRATAKRIKSVHNHRVPGEQDSELCNNFNKENGCNFKNCKRAHCCKKCSSKTHGAFDCKMK